MDLDQCCKRKLAMDLDLPWSARCAHLAHGGVVVEQREIVRRIRSLVVP